MSKKIRAGMGAKLLCVAALALLTGACQSRTFTRSYVADPNALEQIKPGSSAEQVVLVMGTPSTVSTVGGKTYYYVTQQVSQSFQFMPKHITDQRVLTVYLDKNNKVERLANYGLKDGKIFDFISEKTPSGGQEQSILGQLMHLPGSR